MAEKDSPSREELSRRAEQHVRYCELRRPDALVRAGELRSPESPRCSAPQGRVRHPPLRDFERWLQQIADGRVQCDARRGDVADDVDDLIPQGVVCIERESSGVVLSVWTQRDFLDEPSWARGIPDAAWGIRGVVRQPGKVIELVLVYSGLLPNAHAKVPVLRWPRRVHQFCSVAVPRD